MGLARDVMGDHFESGCVAYWSIGRASQIFLMGVLL
jgi:hypothetical protein